MCCDMNGSCTFVVLDCSRIIWRVFCRMNVECTRYLPAMCHTVIEVWDQSQGGCLMLCILVKITTNVCGKVVPSEVRIYLFLVVDNWATQQFLVFTILNIRTPHPPLPRTLNGECFRRMHRQHDLLEQFTNWFTLFFIEAILCVRCAVCAVLFIYT